MPDYSKGKIYTIRNRNDDTKIYVGSTIQPLAVRFAAHKRDCKTERCMNMKLYIEVNNNWDNWYIELYENYSCSSREELCKREGEVIRLVGNLNMIIAGRDNKQYYIDNADKIKQYYIDNADRIKEQKKLYYIENAENIKGRKKQYLIENAEKINERSKNYYFENAEKINEKKRQYRIENAEKIKEQNKKYYLKNKLKQTQ